MKEFAAENYIVRYNEEQIDEETNKKVSKLYSNTMHIALLVMILFLITCAVVVYIILNHAELHYGLVASLVLIF